MPAYSAFIHDFLLFFTGIFFLALFYWIISFFYTKSRIYLILIFTTASTVLFNLNTNGVILHYEKAELVIVALVIFSYSLLAMEFNGLKKNLSTFSFNLLVIITSAIISFQVLSPFFLSWRSAFTISYLLFIAITVYIPGLFLYLWLVKRNASARFSFWSFLPTGIATILISLAQIEVLPKELKITSAIAVSTFMFALIYVIKKRAEERTGEQMVELELQSLRAKLNPHFMFNCLTAIQQMILKDDTENSHIYLARFSKLLRMLLENSDKPFSSLQKEMDFIELYLSLEKLRMPDLQIMITTDPCINKKETIIPNMILQPYIENALWHGLSHKKVDRKLELNIHKQNGSMIYEVKDNGVGRKRSAELKNLYPKDHQSKGMELLAKRFKLLNEEFGSEIRTEVSDVMTNGEPGGTKVTIEVPDSLKTNHKNHLS